MHRLHHTNYVRSPIMRSYDNLAEIFDRSGGTCANAPAHTAGSHGSQRGSGLSFASNVALVLLISAVLVCLYYSTCTARARAARCGGVMALSSSQETAPDTASNSAAVVIENQAQMDDLIESHRKLFVIFTASWCQHCEHVLPRYNKAAAEVRQRDSSIGVAHVEEQVAQTLQLHARYGVNAYPTLLKIDGTDKSFEIINIPDGNSNLTDYLIAI